MSTALVHQATARSVRARTARLHYAADQGSPAGDSAWLEVWVGEANLPDRRTHFTFMGERFAAVAFPADVEEYRGRNSESLFIGGAWYVKAAEDMPWKRWRQGGPGSPKRVEDPTWALDLLSAVSQFEDAGADAVSGVPARHYVGQISRPSWRPTGWPKIGAFRLRAAKEVDIHVWVDSESERLVRISWSPRKTVGDEWHVTELFDYGAPASALLENPGDFLP